MAQLLVAPLISFKQIIPDFLTILVVLFTLSRGQLSGTIFGGIIGLLFDLFSGGILGSAMFSKTICGFIAGYFYNEAENSERSLFKIALIILLCSIADSLFYTLLGTSEIDSLVNLLISQSLLSGTFTMLVSLPILAFKLFRKL